MALHFYQIAVLVLFFFERVIRFPQDKNIVYKVICSKIKDLITEFENS